VLLSAVIGAAFSLLALVIDALRDSEERANHALQVLVAANRLERLVIDVETAQRGFIITGETGFLDPWYQAQRDVAKQAAALERLASAGNGGQDSRARQITQAVGSYITGYAVPLVTAARRDPGRARTVAVTEEGKRRVDALRNRFERFMAVESQIFETGQDRAEASAHWALVAATVSVAGSIALILLSGGYLVRSVVRPVRRASAMAGRVAGGDLTVRMPETGPGEVGVLERALNTMAGSLEESRAELAASRAGGRRGRPDPPPHRARPP
jgi:CHASE3 domain sensor protein